MTHQKKPGFARRATVGVAKAWAYSLGLTSLAREGQRISGNPAALGRHVRRKLSSSPADFRHESFEAAVTRLGLEEAHLIRQARAFNTRAFSWLAALALATCWLAGVAWTDAPLSHLVLSLGAMLMTTAKSFTWRFRACQVRDKRLHAFWPWLLNPGRW